MQNKIAKDEIEKNPGVITANIMMDIIKNNDYRVWIISDVMQNGLYITNMNNESRSIVAFTDNKLALSYTNRKNIINTIKLAFGKQLLLIGTSILHIHKIVNMRSAFQQNVMNQHVQPMDQIIINPNYEGDYFLPLSLSYIANHIINNVGNHNVFVDEKEDVTKVVFDKELGKYIETSGFEEEFDYS